MTTATFPTQQTFEPLPRLISAAGPQACRRFLEFFAATIRNRNTRAAYFRSVTRFCRWCERRQFTLELIEPITAAAYIEELGRTHAAPTVKQHLAALRVLFDWLVTGQILPHNPLASVRGPKHVEGARKVRRGSRE